MDTRILLVRHAHTNAVGHRLLGRGPCPGISEHGHAQAVALAERLAAGPLEAVYASPVLRTRQTAELIAQKHSLAVADLPLFGEVDFGEWTGAAFTDLEGDDVWRNFNEHRSVTRPPDGELMLEVQARAVAGLLELRSRHAAGTAAVVTHADVIRAAVGGVLGVPVDHLLRIDIEPASVSTIVFRGSRAQLTGLNAV